MLTALPYPDYDCAPDAESKAAARLAIGVALRSLHAEAA